MLILVDLAIQVRSVHVFMLLDNQKLHVFKKHEPPGFSYENSCAPTLPHPDRDMCVEPDVETHLCLHKLYQSNASVTKHTYQ